MDLFFSVASPSERRDAIGVVQIDSIGLDGCNICWFNPRDGASGQKDVKSGNRPPKKKTTITIGFPLNALRFLMRIYLFATCGTILTNENKMMHKVSMM